MAEEPVTGASFDGLAFVVRLRELEGLLLLI
jgi:hypothetical protein